MDDRDIYNEVKDINSNLAEIKSSIAEIKVDLKHHIKRSDKHETWLMTLIISLSIAAGAGILKLAPFLSKLIL